MTQPDPEGWPDWVVGMSADLASIPLHHPERQDRVAAVLWFLHSNGFVRGVEAAADILSDPVRYAATGTGILPTYGHPIPREQAVAWLREFAREVQGVSPAEVRTLPLDMCGPDAPPPAHDEELERLARDAHEAERASRAARAAYEVRLATLRADDTGLVERALRVLRERASRATQHEAGEPFGLDQPAVSNLLRGKRRMTHVVARRILTHEARARSGDESPAAPPVGDDRCAPS